MLLLQPEQLVEVTLEGGAQLGDLLSGVPARVSLPAVLLAEEVQDGVGMLLVFNAMPEDLHNQTLTIELEITDLAGDVVSDKTKALIWDVYQES